MITLFFHLILLFLVAYFALWVVSWIIGLINVSFRTTTTNNPHYSFGGLIVLAAIAAFIAYGLGYR